MIVIIIRHRSIALFAEFNYNMVNILTIVRINLSFENKDICNEVAIPPVAVSIKAIYPAAYPKLL